MNKTTQGVLGTGKGDFELLWVSGPYVDVSKVDQRILTRVARVIYECIEVGSILGQPGQLPDYSLSGVRVEGSLGGHSPTDESVGKCEADNLPPRTAIEGANV
jgi:hypothetical protein